MTPYGRNRTADSSQVMAAGRPALANKASGLGLFRHR